MAMIMDGITVIKTSLLKSDISQLSKIFLLLNVFVAIITAVFTAYSKGILERLFGRSFAPPTVKQGSPSNELKKESKFD